MQVELSQTQLLMLRSMVASKRKALARRKPDPAKMGALSTHAIETVATQELDDVLTAASDEKATR